MFLEYAARDGNAVRRRMLPHKFRHGILPENSCVLTRRFHGDKDHCLLGLALGAADGILSGWPEPVTVKTNNPQGLVPGRSRLTSVPPPLHVVEVNASRSLPRRPLLQWWYYPSRKRDW